MDGVDHDDLLSHALRAAARFPVVPLVPASKTPAIERWPRRATRNRRTVRRWWAAYPERNVGVCTGAGLLVVDLDVADHGPSADPSGEVVATGLHEWRRLVDEHGDTEFWGATGLPRTYTVETPSQGWHMYLRVEEPACCRNTTQLLGPRIDTRGSGGFVVGEGSRTADGRRYRALVHRPVAPAPGWLVEALRPKPAPVTPRPRVELSGATALRRWVRAAVRDECARVAAAVPGGRNTALLRAARILGELVGADVLGEDQAVAALREACAGHVGVDGFTELEASKTIASGLGYGRLRPRDLSRLPRAERTGAGRSVQRRINAD